MAEKRTLSCVAFLGSARSGPPHFGMLPDRTGDKILKYVEKSVAAANEKSPDAVLKLEVVDPLNFPSVTDLTTNHGNPTYYATRDFSTLAPDLQKLVDLVKNADCYIVLAPEYNHTISPVLTATMNQVGCSHYANKVSACVCYSGFSSAAGGARCAVALRPFLSELGCLPVSKQVIIPDANKVLDESGEWVGDHKEGAAKTMGGMLEQLLFFADALATKRAAVSKS
eukprot:TRINITY_DN9054_c0_g1_i1.p1 TRINITY_DN9054_c0_g1~~TRINITY_DN9054_c0_g1_i1.p1  ORF type:complete len:226 (-),score=54.20 TRINITY_DN9054_c0_g1_i1:71-748(-)